MFEGLFQPLHLIIILVLVLAFPQGIVGAVVALFGKRRAS